MEKLTKEALLHKPRLLLNYLYGTATHDQAAQLDDLISSDESLCTWYEDLVLFMLTNRVSKQEMRHHLQRTAEARHRFLATTQSLERFCEEVDRIAITL